MKNVESFEKPSEQKKIEENTPHNKGSDTQFCLQVDFDNEGNFLLRTSDMPLCIRCRNDKAYENAIAVITALDSISRDIKDYIVEAEIKKGVTKEDVEKRVIDSLSKFVFTGFTKQKNFLEWKKNFLEWKIVNKLI